MVMVVENGHLAADICEKKWVSKDEIKGGANGLL